MEENKKPIDIMMDAVDWKETNQKPNKEGIPFATHTGILKIGEITLDVCVLNTGVSIIAQDSLEKMFGKIF